MSVVRSTKIDIHPTAIVHPDARLAEGVVIGPYSVIGEDVTIGRGTRIAPHVVIEGSTIIGEECSIYQFSSIGAPPQDKKYKGEKTRVIIGNKNVIREFVTINRGTALGTGKTVIGENNLLMAYVHIAHDCTVGNACVLANAATLGGHISIEDNAIVGGLVAIHQFVRVGRHSMIGGASAITKDVPPYCIVAGNRAALHGLNKIGLERSGFTREDMGILNKSYRILFRSGLTIKEAMKKVDEEFGANPHVRYLIDFLLSSSRGITR